MNREGFTLVELLVLLATVGIMSAVIIGIVQSDLEDPSSTSEAGTAFVFPNPSSYVVDTSGALKKEQIAELNKRLEQIDKAEKAQIAVVVVPTIMPFATIEKYGNKFIQAWKNSRKDFNNDVIIFIATRDRKVHLEGNIPKSMANRIIDGTALPKVKKTDWNGTIEALITGIEAYLKEIK